ncbi:hypothetical protein BD309DRAFT_975007 [Dichomitus squalens]|nr:hypothetical protein BD309DRAFT_975007 [Dichomitus squalens]
MHRLRDLHPRGLLGEGQRPRMSRPALPELCLPNQWQHGWEIPRAVTLAHVRRVCRREGPHSRVRVVLKHGLIPDLRRATTRATRPVWSISKHSSYNEYPRWRYWTRLTCLGGRDEAVSNAMAMKVKWSEESLG